MNLRIKLLNIALFLLAILLVTSLNWRKSDAFFYADLIVVLFAIIHICMIVFVNNFSLIPIKIYPYCCVFLFVYILTSLQRIDDIKLGFYYSARLKFIMFLINNYDVLDFVLLICLLSFLSFIGVSIVVFFNFFIYQIIRLWQR